MSKLLHNKELWGASTYDDVKSLGFTRGFFPTSSSTNDIQSFYRDFKDRPIGLGVLSEHFLGGNAQHTTHSAITDARLTALCYRKMVKFQAMGMTRFSCPVMDELRREKVKKPPTQYDKCTCGKSGPKKKVRGKQGTTIFHDEFSAFRNFDLDNFI